MFLLRSADVRDVAEHPRLDEHDHEDRNDRRNDLGKEHHARRDLHVMAQLQVVEERQRLVHGDERVRLEDHNRGGTTLEHVPSDELPEELHRELLVRDRADHANRDDEDGGDDERDYQRPRGEVGFPDFDGDDGEREHDYENHAVPPVRDLGVDGHQARVNVPVIPQ